MGDDFPWCNRLAPFLQKRYVVLNLIFVFDPSFENRLFIRVHTMAWIRMPHVPSPFLSGSEEYSGCLDGYLHGPLDGSLNGPLTSRDEDDENIGPITNRSLDEVDELLLKRGRLGLAAGDALASLIAQLRAI